MTRVLCFFRRARTVKPTDTEAADAKKTKRYTYICVCVCVCARARACAPVRACLCLCVHRVNRVFFFQAGKHRQGHRRGGDRCKKDENGCRGKKAETAFCCEEGDTAYPGKESETIRSSEEKEARCFQGLTRPRWADSIMDDFCSSTLNRSQG